MLIAVFSVSDRIQHISNRIQHTSRSEDSMSLNAIIWTGIKLLSSLPSVLDVTNHFKVFKWKECKKDVMLKLLCFLAF